ncbi:MAG: recombinase family protein [Desulforudis sp.]|jgi:DNA invertase Pin-like site-specific DNA recombinase|nr:recombinase family protein [Clostridia bacterium]MDQ7791697.1 recombinase family protein [Clostridia bacterium]RJX22861.1 MAG: recombinase family protein [Desulforudis sp.]
MNAIVYAREAEGTDESSPVHVQLNQCKEYARRIGCTEIDIYFDHGITGWSLDRPGLQAALARIKQGEVDYFIFPDLHCLSYKIRDQLLLIKAIEELGIRVAAVCTPMPHPVSWICLSEQYCETVIN